MDEHGLSLAENLDRLGGTSLLYPPGKGWAYSLSLDVLGGVLEAATGTPLPELVAAEIARPLDLRDTGFTVADRARLTANYVDAQPQPKRMQGTTLAHLEGGAVRFSPERIFDPASYPSGGAGMAGSAPDILRFLEAIRSGGAPILRPGTVAEMTRDQVGARAETQGPGWGFGFGWAVLASPGQAKGTSQVRIEFRHRSVRRSDRCIAKTAMKWPKFSFFFERAGAC